MSRKEALKGGRNERGKALQHSLALEKDQCWGWRAVCIQVWPPNLLLRWLHQRKMPYLWWFTQIIKSLNLLGFFCLSCVAFDVAASLCRCNNSLGQRPGARALHCSECPSSDWPLQDGMAARGTWKPTQGMENTYRHTQEARQGQLSAPCCSLEVHGAAERHQLTRMSLANSLPWHSALPSSNY